MRYLQFRLKIFFKRLLVDFPEVTEKASDAAYAGGGLEERAAVVFEEDMVWILYVLMAEPGTDCIFVIWRGSRSY